jgi:hypothetical protein
MIRRLLLALLLLGPVALATPAAAQRNGNYALSGTNPDGSAYDGQVVMQQVGIVSWRVTWDVAGDRIEGIGMSSGEVMSVFYQLGQRSGMGIFFINADGSMTGQWTVLGSSGIGTETLTPR